MSDLNNKTEKIAAIDIGSNAIRFSMASVKNTKDANNYHIFYKERIPLSLGKDVFRYGKIKKSKEIQLLDAFELIDKRLKKEQIHKIRCVATSALRNSENQKSIIKNVFMNTGIVIHVIDGLHEAGLIFSALKKNQSIHSPNALLFDLGGGSLELTIIKDGSFFECHTFKLGTLRILEQKKRSIKDSTLYVEDKLDSVFAFIKSAFKFQDFAHLQIIATGGNPRRMGKLAAQKFNHNELYISSSEIHHFYNDMKDKSKKEIMNTYSLSQNRAHVISAAFEVFQKICIRLGHECEIRIDLPKIGLIDGVFHSILNDRITI